MTLRLNRRHWMAGTASLGLGASLLGCSPPQPALRVGAIQFAGYEFMFLAEQLGWLPQGQVRLVEMRSSSETLRALTLGRLEAAALTLDEALNGLSGGIPLKVVAVFDVSAGADVVMARAPLKTPADLRGRRIGVEDSAVGAVMLAALLEAGGLSPADIQKVATTLPGSADTFRSGTVDAVVTAEPWASALRAEGALPVFDSKAIPGRIVDVLVAREDALATHGPGLTALLRGHFRALSHYRAQPLDMAPGMAKRLQLEPEAVPSAFLGLDLPDIAANRALLGANGSVRSGLPALVALLRAQGLLNREVDTSQFVDDRWVREL